MKKVGILYHPMVEAAKDKAREMEKSLNSSGVAVWICSSWEGEEARKKSSGTGLILSVGGDGTILRAAQVSISEGVPIIGINLGKLGFMTELSADEAIEKLPALLSGEGWIEERGMLQVETSGANKQIFHALNDIVVARGAVARVIYVDVDVDGEHLSKYKADGVILTTATGSTGYSLAAGGPVIYPWCQDFLLVPIVPHLSFQNVLLLPQTAVVALHVHTFHQATLSIDGHLNLPLSESDTIKVKKSSKKTRFLRLQKQSYFYRSLEEKLKGKR